MTEVMTGQTTITIIKIRLINMKEETIKMSSEIRDISLAESGEQKIEWVKRNCDLLRMLEEEFSRTKPFIGKKITLSVTFGGKDGLSVQGAGSRRGRDVCDGFQSAFHPG